MMKKWYQDQKGNQSFMRIAGMIILVVSVIVCVAGVVGFFLNRGESIALVGLGAGMLSMDLVAKSVQKKYEAGK